VFTVQYQDVVAAQEKIAPYLTQTPCVYNPFISHLLDCEIFLKLENLQPIGSFKIRGALNRLLALSEEEKQRGVIAASAGNHAQGVALASRIVGTKAHIVMPKTAPITKVLRTEHLGGTIELVGETYDEASAHASTRAEKEQLVLIPAFFDPFVIAGQGTLGLELASIQPDVVIGSLGGGGLMLGVALALPNIELWGGQASGAPDLANKLKGQWNNESTFTFADGIFIKHAKEQMVTLLEHKLRLVDTVSDEALAQAVVTLLEYGKILAEGAASLPLALAIKHKEKLKGKKVVLIISGGNIDLNFLSKIVDIGLLKSNRRLRINVLVDDKPGSFLKIAEILNKKKANIIQAYHDRENPKQDLNLQSIELTLDVKDKLHSDEILQDLKKVVKSIEVFS